MISKELIDEVVASGPYCDSWESLCRAPQPDWFHDAKFGIFTHWGLYTVPEYRNEWYSRNMYIKGYPEFDHHVETYGPQKDFGYKDFIPMFTAERFDPDEWLDLFKRAGARYYFPVAEHHDGFQMYRSKLSHWNSFEKGPHRDVIGELREATLRHGLHFAVSDHRAEHWWFMGHGRDFDSDVCEPMRRGDFYWPAMPERDDGDLFSVPAPTAEYLDDWLLRVCELIDGYRPELLYFDWWIHHSAFKPYVRKMAAFYYNRGVEWGLPVSICYKDGGMAWGAGIYDMERGGQAQAAPFVWQTDTSIARDSWCYTKTLDYKDLAELLVTLIDAASKNGNLLLNVGPKADGSISRHDRDLLEGVGAWLDANGEGIYATRPWLLAGEGPTIAQNGSFSDAEPKRWTAGDFRFTSKNGDVYAFCLNPANPVDPAKLPSKGGDSDGVPSGAVRIASLASYHDHEVPPFHGVIAGVEQLGAGPVRYECTNDGLVIFPVEQRNPRLSGRHDLPIGFKIIER
ncbi:alpha-L-fucosidase [Bifidobacterium bohemicum]|uniref:alpha-L-fucosidase n=1 Tax=Bifidobacterium bohemicum DSM 22767 TaxID=1437606 RepID=A0A086ZEL8_9BIFI|nr:alpha-L-fucosidase [Bifidobacterium bohemicum]KFI44968.1 alpha-L-fucosidase [Bifidobacterium bohemicum DSM 22767]SCC12317.1 alpha-L-fucosidase [Bifidobacterium bohemicum]